MHVDMGQAGEKRVDQRLAYVAVSRARYDAPGLHKRQISPRSRTLARCVAPLCEGKRIAKSWPYHSECSSGQIRAKSTRKLYVTTLADEPSLQHAAQGSQISKYGFCIESEAASDFALVMPRVSEGEEVIIERDGKPVAVVRPADVVCGRPISESIALAEAHAKELRYEPAMDPDFAADLEEIIKSRKPRNISTWE